MRFFKKPIRTDRSVRHLHKREICQSHQFPLFHQDGTSRAVTSTLTGTWRVPGNYLLKDDSRESKPLFGKGKPGQRRSWISLRDPQKDFPPPFSRPPFQHVLSDADEVSQGPCNTPFKPAIPLCPISARSRHTVPAGKGEGGEVQVSTLLIQQARRPPFLRPMLRVF